MSFYVIFNLMNSAGSGILHQCPMKDTSESVKCCENDQVPSPYPLLCTHDDRLIHHTNAPHDRVRSKFKHGLHRQQ